MPDSTSCIFCELAEQELVFESDLVVAFRDAFPVSDGHTLVVPRRHVATYFDAGALEQAEIWRAVGEVKRKLDKELSPQGYNVGFNAGAAAGQTVMHLHVHVIPRYEGDMDDPRGGVRGVIPDKQKYGGKPAPPRASTKAGPFDGLPRFVPGEDTYRLLPE